MNSLCGKSPQVGPCLTLPQIMPRDRSRSDVSPTKGLLDYDNFSMKATGDDTHLTHTRK